MSSSHDTPHEHNVATVYTIAERLCTWCKVPMMKRLVAGNAYIHYTCPKCIFQHTTKRESKESGS